jgi:hypothetical protein
MVEGSGTPVRTLGETSTLFVIRTVVNLPARAGFCNTDSNVITEQYRTRHKRLCFYSIDRPPTT